MMAINVIQSEFSGSNIEAITVYVYPQFFWLTANSQLTGISSQIKIEKHTRNIIQLSIKDKTQLWKSPYRPTLNKK